MKKLITILMLLLSVASQAQSLVFPVSDTTSVKSKLKGQSQQRTLVEVADGRVFAVGLLKSQELLTSATVVPTSRTITINGTDGISISGGNTQNLSNNRTWSVGISSIDASKIGGGAVSNTEYSYIDGVTSSIQTQLNSKLAISTAASTYATITNLDTKYDASNPDNYTTFYTTNNGGLPIDNELMGKSGDIVLDVANGSFWSYAPVGMTNWWNVFSAYPYSNPLSFITSSTASSTYISKSNNLSDLVSASTARTNLGLTTLATTTPATGVATFLATPSSVNLAAALTDETGTGSVVLNTSPTLATQLTVPKVIGGTGTTSTLIFQTTTGVGTTGANMSFNVGNNGATNAITITNNAAVGFGITSPIYKVHTKATGDFSAKFEAGASDAGVYIGHDGTRGLIASSFEATAGFFPLAILTGGSERIRFNTNGNIGIGTTSPSVILDINNTGAIKIPVGTDAQRPASPATGMLRVNTTASPAKLEYYNGSSWIQL